MFMCAFICVRHYGICTFFQSCFTEPRQSLTCVLEKKLDACQQWCLRRLLRIWHFQRVTNIEVLRWSINQTQLSAVCATDVYGSSDMLPGQMRGWTIREHCAQLFQGYQATGGVLPADPDGHGREPLRKIWVQSASVCTQHGDELRIVNNGNELWKRLCSNMGTALDDDDDIFARAKPCVVAVLRGSVWAALLLSCETGCSVYLYTYTCITCL